MLGIEMEWVEAEGSTPKTRLSPKSLLLLEFPDLHKFETSRERPNSGRERLCPMILQ